MEIVEVITTHLSDQEEALVLLQSFDDKVKTNLEAKTLCKILQAQMIMNKNGDNPAGLDDVEVRKCIMFFFLHRVVTERSVKQYFCTSERINKLVSEMYGYETLLV